MFPKAIAATTIIVGVLVLSYVCGRAAIHFRETAELPADPSAGQFLTIDGHRIHYVDRGTGPVLLLLHGLGRSSVDWEESVLPILARRRRVIAIDFFGAGLSARSRSFAYGWDLWADQAIATLDALGISQADVAGHSLGGTVGVRLAANHPERVRRLVLVGSARSVPWYFVAWLVPGVGELMLGSRAEWGGQARFSESHHRRALQSYRIRGTRDGLLRYARGSLLQAPELYAAFASLELPVLQLHGARDREVLHGAAVALNEQLPTSQLVTFDGGTHYLMFDFPECFVRELVRFLDDDATRSWPPAERRLTRRCT